MTPGLWLIVGIVVGALVVCIIYDERKWRRQHRSRPGYIDIRNFDSNREREKGR